MHTFKVWAPRPRKVEVEVKGRRYPMQDAGSGWWSARVQEAGPDDDYWFLLNNAKRPDPRSPWQPDGINGPSRLLDHQTFRWTDQKWQAPPLSSAIIYELHVGTFTPPGTFQSTIECLPYLKDLGVTHVELMPVNEFSGKWGWGYDGVDLFAPHHAYGTPDDLKTLVNACHQQGLAVILDVVYNHFGPAGNYVSEFGPYFTDAYSTPWGPAVNLDHAGSDETRRFFAENACMWLRDYHFDGLRLDAVHAFFDKSAIHFLEFLKCEVDTLSAQLGRHLILIAESDLNDPRIVQRQEAGGFGIDAQWSDDFHHALHSVVTGEQKGYYEDFGKLSDLSKALSGAFVYDGNYSPHRDRVHGRVVRSLPGHHFLGYSQNHDQIGNRAQGERLSALISTGKQKIAAALVLTSPFVPMLFQGEEFAASTPFQYFTHHDDEELGRKVSEGRRSEFKAFGWKPEDVPDPQDPATFERSKLNWDEVHHDSHRAMLAWYKNLIALRKASADLSGGKLSQVEVKFSESEQWIIVQRGTVQIAVNLNADRHALPIAGTPEHITCSDDGYTLRPGCIELPPESVAILQ